MNKKIKKYWNNKRLVTTTLIITIVMMMAVLIPQISVAAEMEISKTNGLTCGEIIWINVTSGELQPDTDYLVQIEKTSNSSDWQNITIQQSDSDGNISIMEHVPFRSSPGDYTIRLVNNLNNSDVFDTDILTISNIYKINYQFEEETIEYALWNYEYAYPDGFTIQIYNWTGIKYELLEESVSISLYDPAGDLMLSDSDLNIGEWEIDYIFDYKDGNNYETNYHVKIVNNVIEQGYFDLPVRLEVNTDIPDDVVWGETLTITGYVVDGNEEGMEGYGVRLYCPGPIYQLIDEATTFSTGRFTLSAPTDVGNAGTWYIGTYMPGDYRINTSENTLGVFNGNSSFLWYHKISIGSDNSATIKMTSPEELISGFNLTLNLEVNWDDEPLSNAWVYLTGVKTIYNEIEYQTDESILLGQTNDTGMLQVTEILFEDSGKITFSISYPEKQETSDENEDWEANIKGSTLLEVLPADPINVIVDNPPTKVMVDDTTDPWTYLSNPTTVVRVFGETEDQPINASITITGCGVDITLEEDEYDTGEGFGVYSVDISPKEDGTLTITLYNSSNDLTIVKEYEIEGLNGSVITSEGNDKEITVETNETITVTINGGDYAEVRFIFVDEHLDFDNDWTIESIIGDGKTSGKGLNGIFEFLLTTDEVNEIGHVVVIVKIGNRYFYDIVEIVPVHDLVIDITNPTGSNQTLTVGILQDVELQVLDDNNTVVTDIDTVTGILVDENGEILQEVTFSETSDHVWFIRDWIPKYYSEFVITAVKNTGKNEHDGNITLQINKPTIAFTPDKVTAGIELEDIDVEITALDANGNPLPDGTKIYIYIDAQGTQTSPENGTYILIDEQGKGSFKIDTVGDAEGTILFTLQSMYDPEDEAYLTEGSLAIQLPTFMIDPSEVYVGIPSPVTITAYDVDGNAIEGLYLTLLSQSGGILFAQPSPLQSGTDGSVILSILPYTSGLLNVTIARNLKYVSGQLTWDNSVVTNTVIPVTSLKPLKVTVSQNLIYEGETLIVTVTSGGITVSGVTVTFGDITKITDEDGVVTFEVPDPGIESIVWMISAEKQGYQEAEKSVTLMKIFEIIIFGPNTDIAPDSIFTATIIVRGNVLAGATVTFEDQTAVSDANGKVTLTAPSKTGSYTIMATLDGYQDGTLAVIIDSGSDIPGFELITLLAGIALIGIAAVLIRRKKL